MAEHDEDAMTPMLRAAIAEWKELIASDPEMGEALSAMFEGIRRGDPAFAPRGRWVERKSPEPNGGA